MKPVTGLKALLCCETFHHLHLLFPGAKKRSGGVCACAFVSFQCSCCMRQIAETDQYKRCYMAHRYEEGAVRVITLPSGGVLLSQPTA